MPVGVINVRTRLRNVIKRFKFDELESSVLLYFPEITWNFLREKLIKNHENFTVKNALRIIEEALDKSNLRETELQERLLTLEVVDVSRHYKKKRWYSYILKKSDNNLKYITTKDIQNRLIEYFRAINKKVDVKAILYEGITYISLKERGKKGQYLQIMPTFFAVLQEYQYLFCAKKSVSKEVLNAVVSSIGCENSKANKLIGRDLKSLVEFLRIKKQGAISANDIITPAVYKDAEPIIQPSGIDFTQVEQRKKYGERFFGRNPPTLELFVISAPEQSWDYKKLFKKLPDEKINIGWEFRGCNVADFFIKLIEHRIFVVPLPYYATQVMTMGKNILTLQNK